MTTRCISSHARSLRTHSVLLLVLLSAGLASAQTVTSVEPPLGATGVWLTITGSGFGDPEQGAKKPKVRLVPSEGRSIKLKVLSFQDGQIRAELRKKKAPPGAYTVQVKRPGSGNAPVSAATPFQVALPELHSVENPAAFAGSTVKARGAFFGNKRGKVWVGDRRAKVVNWIGASGPPQPVPPNDHIVVALPSKLEPGVHDLRIRNGMGEVVLEDAYNVMSHGVKCKPKVPRLYAILQGPPAPPKMKAKGHNLVDWSADAFDPNDPVDAPAPGSETDADVVRVALRQVLEHAAPAAEGEVPFGSFVGAKVSLSKKTIKMVGLVVPNWTFDEGTVLGDAALALQPLAFYFDGRFQVQGSQVSIPEFRYWAGDATAVDIVVNGDFSITTAFAAEQMPVQIGSGGNIKVIQAVICNAR